MGSDRFFLTALLADVALIIGFWKPARREAQRRLSGPILREQDVCSQEAH